MSYEILINQKLITIKYNINYIISLYNCELFWAFFKKLQNLYISIISMIHIIYYIISTI